MQGVLHARRAHCRAAMRSSPATNNLLQARTSGMRRYTTGLDTPQRSRRCSGSGTVHAALADGLLRRRVSGEAALPKPCRKPSRCVCSIQAAADGCLQKARSYEGCASKRATRAARLAPFSSSLFAGCAWSRALCRACLSAAPESETVAPGVHEPHVGGWRCRTHVRPPPVARSRALRLDWRWQLAHLSHAMHARLPRLNSLKGS